jgi:hypothetical protein
MCPRAARCARPRRRHSSRSIKTSMSLSPLVGGRDTLYCPSRNGASRPISALAIEFKSSKYNQYSSGLNPMHALNSNEIHHFWMDTIYPLPFSVPIFLQRCSSRSLSTLLRIAANTSLTVGLLKLNPLCCALRLRNLPALCCHLFRCPTINCG